MYVGAAGRATLLDAERKGSGWIVQPKLDGAYAEVWTDAEGRAARILSRKGRQLGEVVAELLGSTVGPRNSVLVGEIDAWTMVAAERQEGRQVQRCRIFDALAIEGQGVAPLPFAERIDAAARRIRMCSDERGRARDLDSQRYIGDRRWSIAESLPASQAAEGWERWVERGDAEGLVLLAADAPAGRRGAKKKIKIAEHTDGTVVACDARKVTVAFAGLPPFAVGRGKHELHVGTWVEVAFEGRYASGLPRFPRIVRVRPDLA